MLARIQRGDGAGRMSVVPCANAHRVKLRKRQKRIHIRIEPCDAVPFSHITQAIRVDIAERIKLDVGMLPISLDMRAGNAARADDADF